MFVQGIKRKLFSSVDHFVNFVNLKTEAQEKLVQSANCTQTSARTLEWGTNINIAGAEAGAPRSNGLQVSTLELRPVLGTVIHVLCRRSAPLFAIAPIKRSVNTRAHVRAPFKGPKIKRGAGTSNSYFFF